MTKSSYHQDVAAKIIKQLKAGQAPWIKPWDPASHHIVPYNPTSGKRYRGINALNLMLKDSRDPRWLTYKQAQTIGAQVRKGEVGTRIQYWKFSDEVSQKDESGKPILDEHGKEVKVQVALQRPKVFYAVVFHAEQIENMPEIVHNVNSI